MEWSNKEDDRLYSKHMIDLMKLYWFNDPSGIIEDHNEMFDDNVKMPNPVKD